MFYSFIRWLANRFIKLFYRFKSYNADVIPKKGKVLIISNHISWTDVVAVWALTKRKCYFMAKTELFKNPIIGFVINKFGAFPVKRGKVDRTAYEKTIELLNAGEVVVIFPEGKRHKEAGLIKFHSGAARFALTTGSPVAPVVLRKIKGGGFLNTSKIEAVVGELIEVEPVSSDVDIGELSEETQKLTDKFFDIMAKLWQELDQKLSNGE